MLGANPACSCCHASSLLHLDGTAWSGSLQRAQQHRRAGRQGCRGALAVRLRLAVAAGGGWVHCVDSGVLPCPPLCRRHPRCATAPPSALAQAVSGGQGWGRQAPLWAVQRRAGSSPGVPHPHMLPGHAACPLHCPQHATRTPRSSSARSTRRAATEAAGQCNNGTPLSALVVCVPPLPTTCNTPNSR